MWRVCLPGLGLARRGKADLWACLGFRVEDLLDDVQTVLGGLGGGELQVVGHARLGEKLHAMPPPGQRAARMTASGVSGRVSAGHALKVAAPIDPERHETGSSTPAPKHPVPTRRTAWPHPTES